MNDEIQLQIDFRTGFPTAIWGDGISVELRSACSALNRERTSGLLEAAQQTPPGESVPADVWSASFTRRAQEWEVPIVDFFLPIARTTWSRHCRLILKSGPSLACRIPSARWDHGAWYQRSTISDVETSSATPIRVLSRGLGEW